MKWCRRSPWRWVIGRRVSGCRSGRFRAAAAVLESTLSPLGIQPPLTQRRLDFFTKSFIFSTQKCRKVLNFVSQTPFEVGAVKTAQWYRDAAICDQ